MMRPVGRALLTVLGLTNWLAMEAPSKAAEDLSSFGEAVETPRSVHPTVPLGKQTDKRWPDHVCAEIQRMEKIVISGARPTDRGMTRIGLLLLEQMHCGVDVSKKIAADLTVLDEEQRKAQRDFEDNMSAALSAASEPQEPIIVQVPQSAPAPMAPAPPPTVSCFTTRLVGGMSTTTCR